MHCFFLIFAGFSIILNHSRPKGIIFTVRGSGQDESSGSHEKPKYEPTGTAAFERDRWFAVFVAYAASAVR